jgi:acetyl esterase/lipase
MSDDERSEFARKTIVLHVPSMDAVIVRQDVPYRDTDDGPLTFDLYSPAGLAPGERRPCVLFVFGFPDPAFANGLKRMGAYTSWGRLLAASGMHAVTYTYRDPVTDVVALRRHLHEHAAVLDIDIQRTALWACSGNVPMALALLMSEPKDAFRCAVLAYGIMLDVGGAGRVGDVAARFGFHYPAGRSIDELPAELPLFITRAGRDEMPLLNPTLDAFVSAAIARNLPITFVNHPTAPHAFDILDDSEATREVIRAIVGFLRFHLGA